MGKRKPTKDELEARAQMLERNENLLQLAQKAEADLDRRKRRES